MIQSINIRGINGNSITGSDPKFHESTRIYPGDRRGVFGAHISISPESGIPAANTSIYCSTIHLCLRKSTVISTVLNTGHTTSASMDERYLKGSGVRRANNKCPRHRRQCHRERRRLWGEIVPETPSDLPPAPTHTIQEAPSAQTAPTPYKKYVTPAKRWDPRKLSLGRLCKIGRVEDIGNIWRIIIPLPKKK